MQENENSNNAEEKEDGGIGCLFPCLAVFALIMVFIFIIAFAGQGGCDAQKGGGDIFNTLKLEDTKKFRDISIKTEAIGADITPYDFDLDALAEKNYYIAITVSYNVYYKKSWDYSFGYAGAPKYEAYIMDSNLYGQGDKDITAPSTSQKRSISCRVAAASLKGKTLRVSFSTDNIQNRIYFTNIVVRYKCSK